MDTNPIDEQRWQAVMQRDGEADGTFVFGVRSTGVYCRPSCASRRAKRQNVQFYSTDEQAERAGFRACKRCRPNQASPNEHQHQAVIEACRLMDNAADTPSLAELAESAGMSPSHFHRVFKMLTGLTPKSYASAKRSKRVRDQLANGAPVTEAIYGAGFNSNGRFYATSTEQLGMKPATFRAGGKGETIRFAIGESSLGAVLVAASDKGVCAIFLGEDPDKLAHELQDRFPNARIEAGDRKFDRWVAQVVGFVERPAKGLSLPLDIRGTAFQVRVWEALRKIPVGSTMTYTQIAKRIGHPNAVRAVGSACGANPIAVAIPCHRVVRTDESLAGYRWGVEIKAELLKREGARKVS